ncbi:MAG TPA: hypothetical protein PLD15_06180 [Mesotoga sp.]|nr:hypothetical protein [Mesotoga sp.]
MMVLLLVLLLALGLGLTISNGDGDPIGYARAEEAKAKASVDITQILADLQGQIATLQAENDRLQIVLEYQDRAETRADTRQILNTVSMVALIISLAVFTLVLAVAAGKFVGTQVQPTTKRRRHEDPR